MTDQEKMPQEYAELAERLSADARKLFFHLMQLSTESRERHAVIEIACIKTAVTLAACRELDMSGGFDGAKVDASVRRDIAMWLEMFLPEAKQALAEGALYLGNQPKGGADA